MQKSEFIVGNYRIREFSHGILEISSLDYTYGAILVSYNYSASLYFLRESEFYVEIKSIVDRYFAFFLQYEKVKGGNN